MTAPLDGIRVLDLTRALSGPYCTMMLGDMGADVVKIEMPDGGDESRMWGPPFLEGETSYFMSVNRNKRSVVLDLKSAAGVEAIKRLVGKFDVLVENFRPGVLARLSLGYEDLQTISPSLIFCSITGYGQTGPRASEPAYDAIIQGQGGVQSLTGEPGGPPLRIGVPLADLNTGMFAAYAIAAALFRREMDPQRAGQWIDTSMLGSMAAILSYHAGRYFATGSSPPRMGNRHGQIAPYEMFETRDGGVNVACANDALWRRFCVALQLEHLLDDPRFVVNADRVAHREALAAEIEGALKRYSSKEVVGILQKAQVPVGSVYDLGELFQDVQAQHLDLALPTPHPKVPDLRTTGFPYRLSGTPAAIRRPPPLLGEHTQEVLAEVGLGSSEVIRA